MMLNIYATQEDPMFAARDLDDRRLNRTIYMLYAAFHAKYSAQYIATTRPDLRAPIGPALTRDEVRTISRSRAYGNLAHPEPETWCKRYLTFLFMEYAYREGVRHPENQKWEHLRTIVPEARDATLRPFISHVRYQFVGINFSSYSAVDAYKMYLNARWRCDAEAPHWTNRPPPAWYNSLFNSRTRHDQDLVDRIQELGIGRGGVVGDLGHQFWEDEPDAAMEPMPIQQNEI